MAQEGGQRVVFCDGESVFCDTNILQNYLNLEWERDQTSELLEHFSGDIVTSDSVEGEFLNVVDRRSDIYPEFLTYLSDDENSIGEYSISGRNPDNDYEHIRKIQQELMEMDRIEAAARLRRFSRRYEAKAEYIIDELIAEIIFTAPPFELSTEIDDTIGNSDDAKIVSEAADWTKQGGDGNLAALDRKDILNFADEINEIIKEKLGPEGCLQISEPCRAR